MLSSAVNLKRMVTSLMHGLHALGQVPSDVQCILGDFGLSVRVVAPWFPSTGLMSSVGYSALSPSPCGGAPRLFEGLAVRVDRAEGISRSALLKKPREGACLTAIALENLVGSGACIAAIAFGAK